MNYVSVLRDLELQKVSIQHQVDCGILDTIDAIKEIEMIEKKQFKAKEKLIEQYHKNKNGTPRKITYREDKELYTTFMPNRKNLTAKSLNDLYDKLLKYYNLTIYDTSFKTVFSLALEKKSRSVVKGTTDRKQDDYKRFITDEFGQRDIRQITLDDLEEYTQNLLNTGDVITSALKKYKGVLNLAFEYAHAKGIIQTNPTIHLKIRDYKLSCADTDNSSEAKIHSPKEIEEIKKEVRERMSHPRYKGYFITGYAILFSIETGVRVAELCSLKWADVKDNYIHIHSQQLEKKVKGEKGRVFYFVPYTKNEKRNSKDGRKFPLTNDIKSLLGELKALQEELGISSEFIFCHEDGEWIKTRAYQSCLREMCKKLGMHVTNNHAFRMSLNSNVFVPLGMQAPERAKLLGHSVETNLKYYTFPQRDNFQNILDILNKTA